jgi:hypothetical protein
LFIDYYFFPFFNFFFYATPSLRDVIGERLRRRYHQESNLWFAVFPLCLILFSTGLMDGTKPHIMMHQHNLFVKISSPKGCEMKGSRQRWGISSAPVWFYFYD